MKSVGNAITQRLGFNLRTEGVGISNLKIKILKAITDEKEQDDIIAIDSNRYFSDILFCPCFTNNNFDTKRRSGGGSMGLDGLQNQFILNIESSNENTETTESTQTPKQ